jgi:predicted dehydrogenase
MKKLIMIGAGAMAYEYSKILNNLEIEYDIVCRKEETAKSFFKNTGILPKTAPLQNTLLEKKYDFSIIATTIESLSEISLIVAKSGVPKILVEKPGAVNKQDINNLMTAQNYGAEIYIAYNRRFYSSVQKAKEIIQQDGGAISCTFDFTEWPHVIEKSNKTKFTKENWFLANSTHVIDMVFYLIGLPKKIDCHAFKEIEWHKFPSLYVGAGKTENNIFFSYHSNWNSPGRWSVEVNTRNFKLIFKPLEKLKIQSKGSLEEIDVDLNNELDMEFKPGLYKQVENFINSKSISDFCNVDQLALELKIFNRMAGVT